MTLLRDPGRYQEKQKPPIITHYSCAAVSFVSGYFLCKRQKTTKKTTKGVRPVPVTPHKKPNPRHRSWGCLLITSSGSHPFARISLFLANPTMHVFSLLHQQEGRKRLAWAQTKHLGMRLAEGSQKWEKRRPTWISRGETGSTSKMDSRNCQKRYSRQMLHVDKKARDSLTALHKRNTTTTIM